MATLTLSGINKRYPNGAHAVRGVNMTIADGEFVVFVGPSGCGKSTLLRMVAGLESITEGDISIDGERINDTSPSMEMSPSSSASSRSIKSCLRAVNCRSIRKPSP